MTFFVKSLQIHVEESGDRLVVRFVGEAAHAEEKVLDRQAKDLSARGAKLVVLDLSGMTFMSSVGIRAMVAIQQAVKETGGRVVLAAVPERILAVLRRCKLDGQFDIQPSANV